MLLDDVVVVVGVVDVAMLSVEVLSVVVSLDVVVVFHYLTAVVDVIVVIGAAVLAAVLRVMCVAVFQGQVHLGTLVVRPFGHQVTVGTFVVTVVEVTDEGQFLQVAR